MNFNNYTIEWELDYNIALGMKIEGSPIAPEMVSKCMHFTNIKPKNIKENRSKSNKIDESCNQLELVTYEHLNTTLNQELLRLTTYQTEADFGELAII